MFFTLSKQKTIKELYIPYMCKQVVAAEKKIIIPLFSTLHAMKVHFLD